MELLPAEDDQSEDQVEVEVHYKSTTIVVCEYSYGTIIHFVMMNDICMDLSWNGTKIVCYFISSFLLRVIFAKCW